MAEDPAPDDRNTVEHESVRAFLQGDRAGVDVIRSVIRAAVRSFRFSEPDVPEDLEQETLCRLVWNLKEGKFRGDGSLQAYADTIARYVCLEYIRRKRVASAIDPEELPSSEPRSGPEAALLRSEEWQVNTETYLRLPHESHQLLQLIFVERLPYRDVAVRLGLSEGAIKSRIHRLRLALRASRRA